MNDPAIRPLYWSVRRELWENRSLYVAPLVVAAVFFFAYAISTITLPRRMRAVPALEPMKQIVTVEMPYSIVASLIILTTFVVGAFYCLDALYGERRDRSVLFWKSLPVSDPTTVLSKMAVPLVVLPVLACAIAFVTQVVMLVLSTAVLLVSGSGVVTLWTRLPFVQMPLVMLYGVAAHALWFAPLYAWLLLVSAWARRTPLLWAVLPPLALGLFERIAFQTSYFGSLVKWRLGGAMTAAFTEKAHKGRFLGVAQLDPLGFLMSPGLWLGLLGAAAFLVAAARLRRLREPI